MSVKLYGSVWRTRADHRIGITEAAAAFFVEGGGQTEYDFCYDAMSSTRPSQSYSLNLWLRQKL